MKKNLKISLLALTCFGLSAVNKEVSQADFIKSVTAAVADYGVNGKNSKFETKAYMAAALFKSKDSDLKLFLGENPDNGNLVLDNTHKLLIVKGKEVEAEAVLSSALTELKIEEKDAVSKVKSYLKNSEKKAEDNVKSNKKWWIIGGVVSAVVVLGLGYYLYSQNQSVDI